MKTRYDPNRHHRRSIRLSGWDYTSPGAYFVTVCTHQRLCLFGTIVADEVRLSRYGRLVDIVWRRALDASSYINLDILQVMPNHLHAIVLIQAKDGPSETDPMLRIRASCETAPSTLAPIGGLVGPKSGELGAIVGNLKSICTRRINGMRHVRGETIWQRNYWEHIIRDEDEYNRIYHYAATNPVHWADDRLYAPELKGDHLD
jgi:putative transposase